MSAVQKSNSNEPFGYYYEVTDLQIQEHQKWSITEILEWIEATNEFIWKLQTKEERTHKNKFKRKY